MVAKALRVNFRYPKMSARIRIHGDGFNPDLYGTYIGNDENGDLLIDIDLDNLLPAGMKIYTLSQYAEFDIL